MPQKAPRPAPLVGGANRATSELHLNFDCHTSNRPSQRPQATLQASIAAEALRQGAIAKVGPSKSPSLGWADALKAIRRVFPNDDEYRRRSLIGEFVIFSHATEFFGHNHLMNRRLPVATLKLIIERATGNSGTNTDALLAALTCRLFKVERKRIDFYFSWFANVTSRVGDPMDRTKRIRIIDIKAFPPITFFWPDGAS